MQTTGVVREKLESMYDLLLRDRRLLHITHVVTHRNVTEHADWVDAAIQVVLEKASNGHIRGPITEALLLVFIRRTVYNLIRNAIRKERRRILQLALPDQGEQL